MKRLHMEKRDGLGWLRLDDGKANAIQGEMLSQIDVALDTFERDPDLHGVVLTGRQGYFSAGMDLKLLPTLPDAELKSTLLHLAKTTTRLFTFPKPTVAALSGHAVAGGCVLSLCCDVRLAAEGNYRIGLSEVSIGMAVPSFILGFMREAMPQSEWVRMALHGILLAPEEALQRGWVDALCPAESLEAEAAQAATRLRSLKLAAYGETKRRLRGATAKQGLELFTDEITAFLGDFRAPSR